jgi:glucose/arabinose dehydrogenase
VKRVYLYSDGPIETIAALPAGGRHTTRTIAWGPDDRLYVSIGSTCDACVEDNELHGTIISMKPDGTDQKIVARGLRNAVFFDWSYVDGAMYATEMGRDTLGDTTPPDEIDKIIDGKNYGWPYCYGDRIRDERMSSDYDCAATEPPHIALPAHVAPLGLAFVPEEGWPEEWWYDLLVAEHGSWNSSVKVGYKIVRIPLDAQGKPEGAPVDFLTGFLDGGTIRGRPVDLMIEPGGTLYVSDDQAGVIYRVKAGVEM